MTIRQILEHVDRVKPNGFAPEDKLIWLNELEYDIQTGVFGRTGDFEDHDGCGEEPLLPRPWHKLYYAYLEARIDAANGEWTEYDNAMALFNGFLGEYQRWYARHNVDNPETREREETDA